MDDSHVVSASHSDDGQQLKAPVQEGQVACDRGVQGEVEAGCRCESWFSDRDRR